ncbi:MAG: hypothetical protein ACRDBL_09155 [Rhabdaerophilum sp.]
MREHLPALLAEIADVAGLDAALAIAQAKGGINARFCSRLGPENWLVEAVGMEKAKVISDHFTSGRGRIEFDIPLGPTSSYKQAMLARARAMQRALASGETTNHTARSVGITRRSVQRFKLRLAEDEDPDQRDLF